MNYATIDEAAKAGLKLALDKNSMDGFEWGGVVVRIHVGSYAFTGPVTSGDDSEVSVGLEEAFKIGTPVATYHVHPKKSGDNPLPKAFSMQDGMTDLMSGTLAYMATADDRQVYMLNPWNSDPIWVTADDGSSNWGFYGNQIGVV